MNRLAIKIAGLTDPGKSRSNNEDAVWIDPQANLLIVADGMGGHQAGEVASGLAIKTIPDHLQQLVHKGTAGEVADERLSGETNRLGFCFKIANQMIFEAAKRYPEDHGMGTTCTAALITGGRLSLAHVGDSRCYLIRRGEIEQLTEDHSLVMEQVRHGLLSKDDEAVKRGQNILTRSLGTSAEVKIDMQEYPLYPGDCLLLCSDGLEKELTDDQILEIVMKTSGPEDCARNLIEAANAAGGRDNITVAVAQIEKASLSESILSFMKTSFGWKAPS
ncbi:MAG TPA: Stp1/IreP family PP2C-type Ser/Thr phosphatase [Terriglobia bacterium]